MKKLLIIFITFLSYNVFTFSQEAIQGTIIHNDIERSYILYVPDSYTGEENVPLVINLHGYTSNAGEQMIYSNFFALADTENFLLVHPMGTVNEFGEPFWNSFGAEGVDDIGFISSLIDYLDSEYNINMEKVYSTGMSNGGFMSYTLACELSEKIAAIASVTGSMFNNQTLLCNCNHPMPVMQIHGTLDFVVPYEGNIEIESIDNVISYWVSFNQCDEAPIYNDVPDINLIDLCQAEHYVYENGINGSTVELYKVIGGGHTWPGAGIPIAGSNTNQDFNASEKIWDFFSKYDLNGLINTSDLMDVNLEKKVIQIIDVLGRKSNEEGFFIKIYNDGSSLKEYKL